MGKSTVSPAGISQDVNVNNSNAINLANPNAALAQFQTAAQQIEQQYPGALSAYQSYVQGGSSAAVNQNTQAQLATLPVSSTASASIDQLRGLLGLPGISPTAGLSTSINGLAAQLGNDPNAAGAAAQLSGLSSQLSQAENLTDPAQRATAMQQIQSQFQSVSSALPQQYQATVGAKLSSMGKEFNAGYGSAPGSAWSPETIQAKMEATPGYQFSLNQGIQALDRSAASKGNLLSGNTLAAANQFGQGLADTTYNNQISNLENAINMQAPGLSQQSSVLQNTGGLLNTTGQAQGTAAGNSGQAIAQAGQQAGNLSGQGLLQSSQLQGQMANQGALTNAQLAQQTSTTNAQLQQQANIANQNATTQNNGLLTQVLAKV